MVEEQHQFFNLVHIVFEVTLISSEFVAKWPIYNYAILFVLALVVGIAKNETSADQIKWRNSIGWVIIEALNFV